MFIPTGFGGIPTTGTDISGNQLIRAPKFSGNIAANYTLETGPGRFAAYAALS